MKKNDPVLFKEVLEEEIKCPLCGEILRRPVERKLISFPIEQSYVSKIEKSYDQLHYVSFNSLAHFFSRMRVDRNLTVEDFSKKIGFPKNYIESVERGERVPNLKYSLICAQEFGMNSNFVKIIWAKEMTSWFEEKLINRFKLREEI